LAYFFFFFLKKGNGHERDFAEDPNTFIIDFYNHWIYPGDSLAKRGIKLDISITNNDVDNDYFQKMNSAIPKALDEFKPDFILYNAGTDCMENDPLGSRKIIYKKTDHINFDQGINW
jgi:histone deacetylase 11